jgi:hypothetical protein
MGSIWISVLGFWFVWYPKKDDYSAGSTSSLLFAVTKAKLPCLV